MIRRENNVLAGFTPLQRAALSPWLLEAHLIVGETLYERGQELESVYFPTDAVLSVVAMMGDGRSVEAMTVGNEGVVGVVPALGRVRAHSRTFVQIAGAAWKLPASRLREVAAEDPAFLEHLLAHVQQGVAQAEQAVACNALHPARERLAKWLLLSQDRVQTPLIPLTQEYLAVILGVQRTTVTSVAKDLKEEGIIAYRRGRIEVLDRDALKNAACECYRDILEMEIAQPQAMRPSEVLAWREQSRPSRSWCPAGAREGQ